MNELIGPLGLPGAVAALVLAVERGFALARAIQHAKNGKGPNGGLSNKEIQGFRDEVKGLREEIREGFHQQQEDLGELFKDKLTIALLKSELRDRNDS